VKSTHTGTDAEAEDTGQLSNAVVGHVQVASQQRGIATRVLHRQSNEGGDAPNGIALCKHLNRKTDAAGTSVLWRLLNFLEA
jgi:hypothetical protein